MGFFAENAILLSKSHLKSTLMQIRKIFVFIQKIVSRRFCIIHTVKATEWDKGSPSPDSSKPHFSPAYVTTCCNSSWSKSWESESGSSQFYNASARHERHECNTGDTSVTLVTHERHDGDTSEKYRNVFSHLYISYLANKRL